MDPAVFVNVNVSDLDMSHNRIQSLHPVLFASVNRTLRSLKIGGNPLQVSHLWSAVLSPNVGLNLRTLDVSDLALGNDQHFQVDLFSFQKHLKSLNVSGTRLNALPVEMVQSLPSLKELDLSRNQLASLSDKTVAVLSSLLHLVTLFFPFIYHHFFSFLLLLLLFLFISLLYSLSHFALKKKKKENKVY